MLMYFVCMQPQGDLRLVYVQHTPASNKSARYVSCLCVCMHMCVYVNVGAGVGVHADTGVVPSSTRRQQ